MVLSKIVRKVTDAAKYIVMAAVVLMMALTVVDVIMRKLFSATILGVTEYSQMVMVIILLSTAFTAMNDNHIKVDIVTSRLSQTGKYICEIISLILSFAMAAFMTGSAFLAGLDAVNNKTAFITVKLSKAPFIFLYALGLFVLCLAIICLFAECIRRIRDHE